MTGTIETVSPRTVCLRVFFGAMIILWSLILSGDQAESTRVVAFIVGGFLFYSGWTAVREPKAAIRYALKPSGVVLNLIREWNPPSYRLEIEHEKSLHSFLKERLPFVKVTRQYGSARVKWDIAVGKDVMVELKVGFKTTQKLQRLIGQIDLFQRELDRPLVVVLLGRTDEDLLHDLQNSIRRYENVIVLTKEAKDVAEGDDVQDSGQVSVSSLNTQAQSNR